MAARRCAVLVLIFVPCSLVFVLFADHVGPLLRFEQVPQGGKVRGAKLLLRHVVVLESSSAATLTGGKSRIKCLAYVHSVFLVHASGAFGWGVRVAVKPQVTATSTQTWAWRLGWLVNAARGLGLFLELCFSYYVFDYNRCLVFRYSFGRLLADCLCATRPNQAGFPPGSGS